MTTTETIRIPYSITSAVPEAGVEIVLQPAEREVPEYWDDVRIVTALHKDGSPCLSVCGCVASEDRTTIRRGETVTIGEWTWFGGQHSWLAGYRRTGPSEAEQRLGERIEILEEDLDQEAGLHHLAKEELNDTNTTVRRLTTERDRAQKTVAWWVETGAGLSLKLRLAFWAAVAGWGVAVVVAAFLVAAVIA